MSEDFESTGDGLACQLTFTYTSKYPDELPIVEIENEENFDGVDKNELQEHLVEQVRKLKFFLYSIFLNIFVCFKIDSENVH